MDKRFVLVGGIIFGVLCLIFLVSVLVVTIITGGKKHFAEKDGVGFVEVKGLILDSASVIAQLNELRDEVAVKAIVVRIDSPGGVVGPSQEIHEEMRKLAAKKKVVVSMGSVAASGGYYIAAPATKIFANPGTVTGSIGVLMKFSNVEGLLGKVGMKAFTMKSGAYKDIGSPLRPMTRQDRMVLQGVINNLHSQFIKAVAEDRRLPEDEVRRLADGRFFSGEQALSFKLVDRLGNLEDAVEEAGKLGGIKGKPHLIKPEREKKINIWDFLVESAAQGTAGVFGEKAGISAHYELDSGVAGR